MKTTELEGRRAKVEDRKKAEGPETGEGWEGDGAGLGAEEALTGMPGRGAGEAGGRHGFKRVLVLLVGLLALGAGAYVGQRWFQHARAWVKTDNAYLSGHIHLVSARVAGTVQEVLVEENQWVRAGTVVARLDGRDFEVRRQQAQAQVAQTAAQIEQAEGQVAQARAQVGREQARATKARQDLARAKALFEGSQGAISRQEFEQAQAEADAAAAALEAAQAAQASAGALVGAAQGQAKVAQANLQETELQLSYTEIRAPADGRVGKKNVETGNRVQPGQALLGLVEPEVWVTANYKETQLARLRPGQPAHIEVDAMPGHEFVGRVESVSPASGAQFALLPPDNATGNFTRIVQRVPVKIVFDAQGISGCEERLVPGLSAVVEVRVRE